MTLDLRCALIFVRDITIYCETLLINVHEVSGVWKAMRCTCHFIGVSLMEQRIRHEILLFVKFDLEHAAL